MKNKTKKIVAVFGAASLVAALTLFSGCADTQDDMESNSEMNDAAKDLNESERELQEAQDEYAKKYEEFKMESENKIAENKKTIAELKAKEKMNKADKAELDKQLMELEMKNDALNEKMNNYNDEGPDKWESFKSEFNHDMDGIGNALKDLVKNNSNK